MKFLKILPLLAILNITICFGTNLERYNNFAQQNISSCMASIERVAHDDPDPTSSKMLEKYESFDKYFQQIRSLLDGLRMRVGNIEEKNRDQSVNEKLEEIWKYVSDLKCLTYSTIKRKIVSCAFELLDRENKYGFSMISSPLIQAQFSEFQKMFREGVEEESDSSDRDE